MLSYFIQFQNITETQGFSKSFATPQNFEIKQQHKYSCTTMDKAAISILHIRMDKVIQTASYKKQTLFSQDHSLISRDLVQSTPCLPIHGEIVTITLRIRPWEASIIILKVMNIITNAVIFMLQEVADVDRDVDFLITIILVFLILSSLFTLNRPQRVHLQRHCLRLQIPITHIQVINPLMF